MFNKPQEFFECEIHDVKNRYKNAKTDEQFQAKKFDFCPLCVENKKILLQQQYLKENVLPQLNMESKLILDANNNILKILQELKQMINSIIDDCERDFTQIMKNRKEKLNNLLHIVYEIQNLHSKYEQDYNELKNKLFHKIYFCGDNVEKLKNIITGSTFYLLELCYEFPKSEYNYKILKQQTFKQNEDCKVMAFNLDDTILATGDGDNIFFFNFIDKKLIFNSQVKINGGRVKFLKFVNQQPNQLLAVLDNGGLQIWEEIQQQEFILKHNQLEFIFDNISCIDLQSDWLVCGAQQGTLSFWRNVKTQWNYQQNFHNLNYPLCLSLNDSGTKLISGVVNKTVLIFQYSTNIWSLFQKVKIQSVVSKIKFFGDHFMCYESKRNSLSVYKLKNDNFEIAHQQQLQGKGTDDDNYPIFHSKNGHVVKHSNFLSFLTYSSEKKLFEFNLQVSLKNERFLGCLRNSEEYLIIWDEISKEFQVRQWMKMID